MVDDFNIAFSGLVMVKSSLLQLVSLSTEVTLLDCPMLSLVESNCSCVVFRALADLDLLRVSANSTLLDERFMRPITSKLCVLTESIRDSKIVEPLRISPSIFSDIVSNVTFRCLLDTTSDETPEGIIKGLKGFVACVCEREKVGCEEGLPKGLVSPLEPLLLCLVEQLSLDVNDLLDDILPFNLANSLGDRSMDDNQLSMLPFSALIIFLL